MLGKPNLVGSIKYQKAPSSSPAPMPWSSFVLYDSSSMLYSDSTNSAGQISGQITLSSGTQRVWMDIFSNSSIANRPKMQVSLEYTDGQLTNWWYGKKDLTGGSPADGNCDQVDLGNCTIDINLDAIPPNLTVTINGSSKPRLITIDVPGDQISSMSSPASIGTSVAKFYVDGATIQSVGVSAALYLDEVGCALVGATSSTYHDSAWDDATLEISCDQ